MGLHMRSLTVPVAAAALVLAGAPAALAAQQAPKPVTGVTATARDGAVVVAWKKPTGAVKPTSYVVTTSPESDGCIAKPAKPGGPVPTTCTVRGLKNGTDYVFTVTAKSGTAKSSGAKSGKTAPVSGDLTISGTLSGTLTMSDGAPCMSTWTIEMRTPGDRDPECRLNVIAILADGRAYSSGRAVTATKEFSIDVPVGAAGRKDLTLHITRADGSYVGPIMLAKKTIQNKQLGLLGLGDIKKGAENLGTIDLSVVAAGGATAFGLVRSFRGSQGGVWSCMTSAGAPAGAGRGGYVKKKATCVVPASRAVRSAAAVPEPVIVACESWANSDGALMPETCYTAMANAWAQAFTSVCVKANTVGKKGNQFAQACGNFINAKFSSGNGGDGNGGNGDGNGNGESDPCAGKGSGGDQDFDGIPSAVDVDDNGNGVVDISDPAIDGNCTVEPSKSVRTAIGGTWQATGGSATPVNYAAVVDGLITDVQFSALLDELLSGQDFGIGYYIFKTDFFPGADTDSQGVMPAVWVTCAGVLWCDPATSRATLGTNVNMLNAEGIVADPERNPQNWFAYGLNRPWTTDNSLSASPCSSESSDSRFFRTPCWGEIAEPMRFGSTADPCPNGEGQLAYDPDYVAPAGVPSGARNFFWTTVCSMNGMTRTVSGGGISPNVNLLEGSASARDVISTFDVLTLNYLADGKPASIATTLGTYPITAPMIRTINGGSVNYDAVPGVRILGATRGDLRAVVMNATSAKDLVITFNRPQREAFPGESSASGLHDLHGMNYGIEIEVGNAQFGCGDSQAGNGMPALTSAYSVDSTMWDVRAADGSYASFLAPLRDTEVADLPDEAPGTQTLTISLDVAKCIRDRAAWLYDQFGIDVSRMNLPQGSPVDGTATGWKSTTGLPNNGDQTCIQANLNARGEDRTGGTDSAIQSFCLQFEPGTFASPVQ